MPYLIGAFFSLIFFLFPPVVLAGSLDDAGPPSSPDSAMYTLEDIYNRLNSGTAGSKRSGAFVEPSAGPGSSGHTLDEVMAKAPSTDDANGAVAADVLTGKAFWGLTASAWGTETGTMVNNGAGSTITPGTSSQTVAAGYWSSVNTVSGDTDLAAGNIISGVNIFGVTGTYSASVAIPKTGQTDSRGGSDDGDLQKGVAWPNPRFTDNGNGTVSDNLTGLIWLKNANCFGQNQKNGAISASNMLKDNDCGLSDGSSSGDWRLPNRFELESLLDLGFESPALSNV